MFLPRVEFQSTKAVFRNLRRCVVCYQLRACLHWSLFRLTREPSQYKSPFSQRFHFNLSRLVLFIWCDTQGQGRLIRSNTVIGLDRTMSSERERGERFITATGHSVNYHRKMLLGQGWVIAIDFQRESGTSGRVWPKPARASFVLNIDYTLGN